MSNTQTPYKTLYHVFSDGYDEWYGTRKEALSAYTKLDADNKRLYKETYMTEKSYEETMNCEEECQLSKGLYPS